MSRKRYCQLIVFAAGAVLAAIAVSNLLVDPIGCYPQVHLKAFERLRGDPSDRRARAEMVRGGTWDMMIFGTSRPKGGMPARHPGYSTNRVCNVSVNAARMSEVAVMFDYARRYNDVRRVVLCLDFSLSRFTQNDPSDFKESRFNPTLSLFDYHCKNLLGASATDRSVEFILNVARGKFPPEEQRNGFQVRSLKPDASQRVLFEKVLRTLAYGYSAQRASPEEMKAFRHVLAVCRERGIELTLPINPVHALDLELLRAGGNWERFEDWKRQVVKVVAEESMEGRVSVWDFTGYGEPTTEEVPPAGDSETRMKYYFENSHYTPALGARMLDRMFLGDTNQFGEKITTQNIEAHLQRIRDQRERYAQNHGDEIKWVQQLAQRALARRQVSDTGEEGL